jgi:hypothetical protein
MERLPPSVVGLVSINAEARSPFIQDFGLGPLYPMAMGRRSAPWFLSPRFRDLALPQGHLCYFAWYVLCPFRSYVYTIPTIRLTSKTESDARHLQDCLG